MEVTKKKSIILVCLFTFIQILLLLKDFSWSGLIITSAFVIYITVKIFAIKRSGSFEVQFCNLISLSFLCIWINRLSKIYIPNGAFNSEYLIDKISGAFSTDIWLIIILTAIFIGSLFLGMNNGIISIGFKYLVSFLACQGYQLIKSTNRAVDILLIIFIALSLILDLKVYNEIGRGSKNIFFNTLLIELLVYAVKVENGYEPGSFTYELFDWNTIYFVLILIFFVAGAYLIYAFERNDENNLTDASSNIALIGIDILFLMLLTKNSSELSWILMLVLAVINIILLFSKKISAMPNIKSKEYFKSKNGIEILGFLLLIMLLYSIKFNFFAPTLILVIFILFSIYAKDFGLKCIIQNAFIFAFSTVSLLITERENLILAYLFLFIISSLTILIINADIEKRSYVILNGTFRNKMVLCLNLAVSIIPVFKFLNK